MNKIPNNYYKRERIIKLLKDAIKSKITYIFAPIGTGKTIAVKQLEEGIKSKFFWLDCDTSKNINIENVPNKYIVIDNFSLVKSENKEYILEYILKNKENKFIILSRKPIDIKLKSLYYSGDLTQITVNDINFDISEIKEFYKRENIKISNSELQQIFKEYHGHAIVINILAGYLKKEHYNAKIYNAIRQAIIEYVEYNIFSKIEKDTMNFIKRISFISEINVDSVNYILNINNATEMLKKVESKGGFLYEDKYGDYQFLYAVQEYFQEQAIEQFGSDKIKNLYLRAARYYKETENNLIYASEYYILAGEYEIGAKTLIKQSMLHLGIINYKELEKYIVQIPVEIVAKYPELCITLAHIYRLNDKDEQANYWYNNFEEIKEKLEKNTKEYDRLDQMKIYYNICMPGTNDIKLIKYFQILYKNIKENTILDTITFTGNQPSVLSGGKDLSNWGKHYKVLYPLLTKLIWVLFKKNQLGSGDVAVAELLYENNRIEESFEYVTKAISVCQNIDILFAAYSLIDKICLVKGENSNVLETFRKKIEEKNAKYLNTNYEARIIENAILQGNIEEVREWLYDNKIDIIERFNSLERYAYFTLVRAFITIEKYTEALIVLERLYEYIKKYNRIIYEMEYHILKSICLYRIQQKANAFKSINLAITIAKKFNYIRLFADEGIVVNEILKEYQQINKKIEKEKFYKQILKETNKYGEMYPNKYKKIKKNNLSILTKKEIEIIELMKKGKTNKEICEEQSVSMATVKTHINHIYSKLDTKNRVQTINKIEKEYE